MINTVLFQNIYEDEVNRTRMCVQTLVMDDWDNTINNLNLKGRIATAWNPYDLFSSVEHI